MNQTKRTLLTLAIFTAFVTLAGCGKPGPGDSVSRLQTAVGSGDTAAALEVLNVGAIANSYGVSEAAVKSAIEGNISKYRELGGLRSVSIDKEEVTDRFAVVVYTLRFGDGKVETQSIRTMQDDFDRWKVHTFATVKK